MRASEAWEGYVGNQTAVEFWGYAIEQGHLTPEAACAAYAQELPNIFSDWFQRPADAETPEQIATLLARYLRMNLSSTEVLRAAVGRPWNAETQALDWQGYYPIVDELGIIHDVVEADADSARLREERGIEFDEGGDCYRIDLGRQKKTEEMIRMEQRLAQFVEQLNAYDGDNIWEDVIHPFGFDHDATALADPSGMSDLVILLDGTWIVYDEPTGTWRVR